MTVLRSSSVVPELGLTGSYRCKPTLDISRLKCRLLLQLALAVLQAVVFRIHAG
jgi:hypothetical protein